MMERGVMIVVHALGASLSVLAMIGDVTSLVSPWRGVSMGVCLTINLALLAYWAGKES